MTGGTTTIEGPHTFARLVVLAGAGDATATTLDAVSTQLESARGSVYVGCGGALDVSGKAFGRAHAREPSHTGPGADRWELRRDRGSVGRRGALRLRLFLEPADRGAVEYQVTRVPEAASSQSFGEVLSTDP